MLSFNSKISLCNWSNSKNIKYLLKNVNYHEEINWSCYMDKSEEDGIGNEGILKLSNWLSLNSTLKVLCLYQNNIGDEGCDALTETLRMNTTLSILNLLGNKITNKGAFSLVRALAENTTLEKLNLQKNKITEYGVNFFENFLYLYNYTLLVFSTDFSSTKLNDNNNTSVIKSSSKKITFNNNGTLVFVSMSETEMKKIYTSLDLNFDHLILNRTSFTSIPQKNLNNVKYLYLINCNIL